MKSNSTKRQEKNNERLRMFLYSQYSMSVCAFNVVNILDKEEGRISLNSEVEKEREKNTTD